MGFSCDSSALRVSRRLRPGVSDTGVGESLPTFPCSGPPINASSLEVSDLGDVLKISRFSREELKIALRLQVPVGIW